MNAAKRLFSVLLLVVLSLGANMATPVFSAAVCESDDAGAQHNPPSVEQARSNNDTVVANTQPGGDNAAASLANYPPSSVVSAHQIDDDNDDASLANYPPSSVVSAHQIEVDNNDASLANYPPSSVVSAHQIDNDDDDASAQGSNDGSFSPRNGSPQFATLVNAAETGGSGGDCDDDNASLDSASASTTPTCGTAGSFNEYPPTSLESAQQIQLGGDCAVAEVNPAALACAPADELAGLPGETSVTGLLEFAQFALPVSAAESGGNDSGSGGSC